MISIVFPLEIDCFLKSKCINKLEFKNMYYLYKINKLTINKTAPIKVAFIFTDKSLGTVYKIHQNRLN